MQQDVRNFLERFSLGELEDRGVLRGSSCLLQGPSVNLLIELMKEHNVTRLVATDRRWFLTSDGLFSNPESGQRNIREGRVSDLISPGSVFTKQNKWINPYYESYQSPPEHSGDTGFEEEKNQERIELANRVQKLEKDLEAAESKVKRLEKEKQQECAKHEERVEELGKDLAAAQKEAGRVSGLEADLADRDEFIEAFDPENKELRRKNDELDQENNELRKDLELVGKDVRDFLGQFSLDELQRRGVLRGSKYLLQGLSVNSLIELMKNHDVTRLVAGDRDWFLTSDGEFSNPEAPPGMKRGRIADLEKLDNVFTKQNKFINPHFEHYQLSALGKLLCDRETKMLNEQVAEKEQQRVDLENRVRELEKEPPVSRITPLAADDLAKMKDNLRGLMGSIDGQEIEGEIKDSVFRLRREGKIPRLIADVMLMILQARNNLEHPPYQLSATQEDAVRAAWEVVREWASGESLESVLAV